MNKNKQFILTTLIFTIFIIIVTATIYKKTVIQPLFDSKIFSINNSTTILFAGASHISCDIDPQEFKNSINIGYNGEPIYFTYAKLERILKDNHHIKQIYLCFDPIHISKHQDNFISGKHPNTRRLYLDYFFLLNDEKYKILDYCNDSFCIAWLKYKCGVPFSYMRDIKLLVKQYFQKIHSSDYSFWGGHETINQVHLEKQSIDRRIELIFNFSKKKHPFSEIAIESVRKIADLCEANNVTLILLRTPLHKEFIEQIPNIYTRKYIEIVNELTTIHQNVFFLNFSELKLEKGLYLDGDHLNLRGSKFFTLYLNKVMKEDKNKYIFLTHSTKENTSP